MEEIKQKQYYLEEILTKQEINDIIIKWQNHNNIQLGPTWKIVHKELKPATSEIAGFIGLHLKLALDIQFGDMKQKIQLFIKCLPKDNKPRIDFIDDGNFFDKEMSVYRILEDLDDGRPKSWSSVYLCNEHVVVMPDLSVKGFTTASKMELMDYDHLRVAVESIARFHAATIEYQTKNTSNGMIEHSLRNDFPVIDNEFHFKECKWLKTAAKLAVDFLKEFSLKHKDAITRDKELEDKIYKSFIEVCNNLKIHENTINVVLHQDLWANNIMYKYKENNPVEAILIDYQLARIGPPAYDLACLFYYNTNQEIRSKHEQNIKRHYFDKFIDYLSPKSKEIVNSFGYTFESFEEWYEIARARGLITAVCIFPYTLMDSETSKMFFEDPVNFNYYYEVDRSEPVIEYARNNQVIRERLLEACEEYCVRYIFE